MENIICLQRWLLAGKVVGSLNTAEMMAAWLRKLDETGPLSRFPVGFLAAIGI